MLNSFILSNNCLLFATFFRGTVSDVAKMGLAGFTLPDSDSESKADFYIVLFRNIHSAKSQIQILI